ncbi:MAG: PAS domain S-box protein [Alphaproteobacteria bacterium]|nr:PAS domain S-box protein [Alphaproteobacteria bacterium]
MFDDNLHLSQCNEKYAELQDIPQQLTTAAPLLEDIARFTTTHTNERIKAARQGAPYRFVFTRPDGAIIEISDTPLPGGRLLSTCTDITEAHKVAGTLAQSEQQVRAILDHTVEAVLTIGEDKTIKTFNASAEKLFGYTAGEAIGQNVSILMDTANAEVHDAHVQKYIDTGQARIIGIGPRDVRGQHKDGRVFPMALNVSEFFIGSERHFIGTLRDITKRREVEEALRQNEIDLKNQIIEMRDKEERLEQQSMELVVLAEDAAVIRDQLDTLNKQKDRFFSIIAHDLKSPFNALLGFSSILSTSIDNLTKEQIVEYSNLVHRAGGQAFALLEDLLDWSRLQMGTVEFDPQPVDMDKSIEACLFLFEPIAQGKNIRLTAEYDKGLSVSADRQMLDTILRNLINNAIKFTPAGGEISLSVNNAGDWINIAVTDTGVGIPPEKIEKLFLIEVKTSTKGTDGEAGTGLGLHLCKDLVDKHGGEMKIESTVGQGSTFHFTLPVA